MNRTLLLCAATLILAAGLRADGAPRVAPDELRLSLRECIHLALNHNLDIEISRYQPWIDDQSIRSAFGAFDHVFYADASAGRNRLAARDVLAGVPLVSTEDSLFRTGIRRTIPAGLTYDLSVALEREESNSEFITFDPLWQQSFGLALSYPLLRGSGEDASMTPIVLARNARRIAVADFERLLTDTVLSVQDAYWTLVATMEVKRFREQALDAARRLVEDNKARERRGVLARVDVTEAEAGVASQVEGILTAENAVQDAMDRLKRLIDPALLRGDTQVVPLDAPGRAETALDEKQAIERGLRDAMELRTEYRAIFVELESRERELARTRNEALPKLDAQASGTLLGAEDTFSSSQREFRSTESWSWSVGVSLERIIVIPDDVETIARVVGECAMAYEYVFTSGGVGPTHDDMTIEGVARAFGRAVVVHEELVSAIEKALGSKPAQPYLKMAEVPEGAMYLTVPLLEETSPVQGLGFVDQLPPVGEISIVQQALDRDVDQIRIAEEGLPVGERQLHGLREPVQRQRILGLEPCQVVEPLQQFQGDRHEWALRPRSVCVHLDTAIGRVDARCDDRLRGQQIGESELRALLAEEGGDARGDVAPVEAVARGPDRCLAPGVRMAALDRAQLQEQGLELGLDRGRLDRFGPLHRARDPFHARHRHDSGVRIERVDDIERGAQRPVSGRLVGRSFRREANLDDPDVRCRIQQSGRDDLARRVDHSSPRGRLNSGADRRNLPVADDDRGAVDRRARHRHHPRAGDRDRVALRRGRLRRSGFRRDLRRQDGAANQRAGEKASHRCTSGRIPTVKSRFGCFAESRRSKRSAPSTKTCSARE